MNQREILVEWAGKADDYFNMLDANTGATYTEKLVANSVEKELYPAFQSALFLLEKTNEVQNIEDIVSPVIAARLLFLEIYSKGSLYEELMLLGLRRRALASPLPLSLSLLQSHFRSWQEKKPIDYGS